MVGKVNLFNPHAETFGNPAPLGLLGLSVGCASLLPIAFGFGLTREGFLTAAVLCFLFGGLGQLFTGLMEMRNRNGFGGAIFTLFSFQWMMNAWELYAVANGTIPDHAIKLAVELVLLMILVPLTFGFGFFSKLLFYFLLVIDVLFVIKIVKVLLPSAYANSPGLFDYPLAILTMMLGGISIYIALAALINPVAGRQVFRLSGPLFVLKKKGFDWTLRHALFSHLYQHWQDNGYATLTIDALKTQLADKIKDRKLIPDLFYLWDFGYLHLDFTDDTKTEIQAVRLNAQGIDLHEQLVLRKYDA